MKKFVLFVLLSLLMGLPVSYGQKIKNFFKYATVYSSGNLGQPLQEADKEWYVTQNGEIQEVTEIYPFDYTISIGIRKMARFNYEQKPSVFYDGTEENTTWKANLGIVEGFEYTFSHDWVRQWGDTYQNQNYFLRYLGKYWVGHVKFLEVGVADLKYAQADLRGRLTIGKYLNLTVGGVVRTHGPYGYNPIGIYLSQNNWWDLAYEYEYTDEAYQLIDYSNATCTCPTVCPGLVGPDTLVDWFWNNPQGERIAGSDEEFRRHHYGDIVNEFNREKLNEVGGLMTLSAAIGLDFYKYSDKFWCHTWINVLPYHQHIYGDSNFSYGEFISRDPNGNGRNQWIDYNCGLIIGAKMGKHFGLFLEGDYLRYWDRTVYSAKAGINYLIF